MSRWLGTRCKNFFYAVAVFLFWIAVKPLFRFRVTGRENLKPDGQYIAVARHRSYWDIPLVAAAFGVVNKIHFIARKGLLKDNRLVRPILRTYTTIIDRENFGRDDFRRMLASMKRERLIGLFPEGTTRHQTDAKAGAVHFASLTNKELLPVNISAEGSYPPKYPFGFPKVTVSIGKPFSVESLAAEGSASGTRSEQVREMSERLMSRVDNA